jgi:hypothetical protein
MLGMPVKKLVVNSASQISVLFYNSAGVTVTVFNAGHTANVVGYAQFLKEGIVTKGKISPVASASSIDTVLFNSVPAVGTEVELIVRFAPLDMSYGESVVHVPNGFRKVYRVVIDSTITTPTILATKFESLIKGSDANDYNRETFTVSRSTATLTFTQKLKGVKQEFYVDPAICTITNTQAPTLGIGQYENIVREVTEEKLKPYAIQRNLDETPQRGASYVQYFISHKVSEPTTFGGMATANEIVDAVNEYKLFVRSDLTALITELDKIVA